MQDSSLVLKIVTMLGMRSFWRAMFMVVLYSINSVSMIAAMMVAPAIISSRPVLGDYSLVWILLLLLIMFVVLQAIHQLFEFVTDKGTNLERHTQLAIEGYRNSIFAINIVSLIFMPFRVALFFLGKFRICPT